MSARQLLLGLGLLWAAAIAASLWSLFLTEPTGDSFTRGLNRVTGFVGWQFVGGVLGLFIWMTARGQDLSRPLRWLARLPLIAAFLLAVGITGIIFYALLIKPDPGPAAPDGTVTKPIAD